MSDCKFRVDEHLRVFATSDDGGSIMSQKVEALLLLEILEKLEEIRCCTIDVEDAINPR